MSGIIGVDCEVLIDNQPYYIKPGSYVMRQPRIRQATIRADGSEGYVDLGPGKREWSMTILCVNDLVKFDSSSTGLTGQQYRNALKTSYTSNIGSSVNFTDPINGTVAVHLDSYEERILDLKTAIIAPATGGSLACSYEISITLVEA